MNPYSCNSSPTVYSHALLSRIARYTGRISWILAISDAAATVLPLVPGHPLGHIYLQPPVVNRDAWAVLVYGSSEVLLSPWYCTAREYPWGIHGVGCYFIRTPATIGPEYY